MADLSVADTLAIHQQIALYALYADQRDLDRLGELLGGADFYAQDSLIASKDPAVIRERFGGPWPDGCRRRHVTTNIVVTPDGADSASAVSYYLWLETAAGGQPRILSCGVYRDRFRRVGEAWRFTERRIYGDGA